VLVTPEGRRPAPEVKALVSIDAHISVVVPFTPATAAHAAALAKALPASLEIILAGSGALDVGPRPNVRVLGGLEGKGRALRAALPLVTRPAVVLQEADPSYPWGSLALLCAPILEDTADAVFASRPSKRTDLADRVLARAAARVADVKLTDPLTGQRAFRTEALRALTLTSDDEAIDAELLVKLAAQLYRVTERPVERTPNARPSRSIQLTQARTLLRYAATHDAADNQHEGYTTLERMQGAPNYNRWIGRRFREYLGARVLEVGSGIGTITRELEPGRELLIALEVEPFYVERLRNLFRGKPHVRPYLSDVALADWEALRAERLDTIVLSNVLEHIPDDAAAVRRFRQVLAPGGRVLVLVPALEQLFGSLDQAVGHHRRYTPATLRAVLEENGFLIEKLEWMNLAGIPGWFMSSRVMHRRAVPRLQLKLYDRLAPLLAQAERHVKLPVGMSLFAVARAAP